MSCFHELLLDTHYWSDDITDESFNISKLAMISREPIPRLIGHCDIEPKTFNNKRYLHWQLHGNILCLHDVWLDFDLKNSACLLEIDHCYDLRDVHVQIVNMNGNVSNNGFTITACIQLVFNHGIIQCIYLNSASKNISFLNPLVVGSVSTLQRGGGTLLHINNIKSMKIVGIDHFRELKLSCIADGVKINTITWLNNDSSKSILLAGLSDGHILFADINPSTNNNTDVIEKLYPDQTLVSKIVGSLFSTDSQSQSQENLISVDGSMLDNNQYNLIAGIDSASNLRLYYPNLSQSMLTTSVSDLFEGKPVYYAMLRVQHDSHSNKTLLLIGAECSVSNHTREWEIRCFECHYRFDDMRASLVIKWRADSSNNSNMSLISLAFHESRGEVYALWGQNPAPNQSESTPFLISYSIDGGEINNVVNGIASTSTNTQLSLEEDQFVNLDRLWKNVQSMKDAEFIIKKTMLNRIFHHNRFSRTALAAVLAHDIPYDIQIRDVHPSPQLVLEKCSEWGSLELRREGRLKLDETGTQVHNETSLRYLFGIFLKFIKFCEQRTILERRWRKGCQIMSCFDEGGIIRVSVTGCERIFVLTDTFTTNASSNSIGNLVKSMYNTISRQVDGIMSSVGYELTSLFSRKVHIDTSFMNYVLSLTVVDESDHCSTNIKRSITQAMNEYQGSMDDIYRQVLNASKYETLLDLNNDVQTTTNSSSGSDLNSWYGIQLVGEVSKSILRLGLKKRLICCIILQTINSLIDEGSTNITEQVTQEAIVSLVYTSYVLWCTSLVVSPLNKLNEIIDLNDINNNAAAEKFFNWPAMIVAPRDTRGPSAMNSLWMSLWSRVLTTTPETSSSSFWSRHAVSSTSMQSIATGVVKVLQSSIFSDFCMYLKESQEFTLLERAYSLGHLRCVLEQTDALNIRNKLMQSYAKSQATVAAFSALLPEVAQGDYAEELDARLSNCYDALMTAAPPLITSINDDHQYNNDSNNKDLLEQEFHNKLVEWVTNSPDDADYKAMVYETLNDIASLVDDFVCHIDMNPSQGQCIDHLLDNRSNFVMAFARISHFLRALEVINRSRSLVRRITGHDLALKFSFEALKCVQEVLNLLPSQTEVHYTLQRRMIGIHMLIFHFALDSENLGKSFLSILDMIELAEEVRDVNGRSCWRDALKTLINHCCKNGQLQWLCDIDEKIVHGIDIVDCIRDYLYEQARDYTPINFVTSHDAIYYECLVSFLLVKKDFRKVAEVALEYMDRLDGLLKSSPYHHHNDSMYSQLVLLTQWSGIAVNALSMTPKYENTIRREDKIYTLEMLKVMHASNVGRCIAAQSIYNTGMDDQHHQNSVYTVLDDNNIVPTLCQYGHYGEAVTCAVSRIDYSSLKQSKTELVRAITDLTHVCADEAIAIHADETRNPFKSPSLSMESLYFNSSYGRPALSTMFNSESDIDAETEAVWYPFYDLLHRVEDKTWSLHTAAVTTFCQRCIRLSDGLIDSFFAKNCSDSKGDSPNENNPQLLLNLLVNECRLEDACYVAERLIKTAMDQLTDAQADSNFGTNDLIVIPYIVVDKLIIMCKKTGVRYSKDVEHALRTYFTMLAASEL